MSDLTGQKAVSGNIRGVLSEIHPVYKIDTELNKEGYAADAKATGDAISGVSTDLTAHVSNKNNPHGVTAEQAGARPNTWLPTIAEIGAAPASLATDMATADTNIRKFLTLSASTADGRKLADVKNIDTKNPLGANNRPAYFANDTAGIPSGIDHGIREVFWYSSTYVIIKLTGWDTSGNPCVAYNTYKGSWSGWDWENPPMVLSTEYRTTERYNGKPVYAVAFNGGTLPASGNGRLLTLNGICNIIDMQLTAVQGASNSNRFQFPLVWGDDGTVAARVFSQNPSSSLTYLYIQVFKNLSDYTLEGIVRYTK